MLDRHEMNISEHVRMVNRMPHLHRMKYTIDEDNMLTKWALRKPNPGTISMNEWRLFAQRVCFFKTGLLIANEEGFSKMMMILYFG